MEQGTEHAQGWKGGGCYQGELCILVDVADV